jgi:hypothetical protein
MRQWKRDWLRKSGPGKSETSETDWRRPGLFAPLVRVPPAQTSSGCLDRLPAAQNIVASSKIF